MDPFSTLTPAEQRIAARARDFDLGPLLRLLKAEKYPAESILFESNPEPGTSSSLVHAVTFHREPLRRVVVTLNLGLLGSNTLLPSYFLEAAEQSLEPERFFDFIRFFDHRLLAGFLRAVHPEEDRALFRDWEQTKTYYFRMLGVGSVATLQWLFQLYFPELRVSVTRDALSQSTPSQALRIDTLALLDGTAVLGGRYESDASGFRVELLTEEDTDAGGEPWAAVVRQRLEANILELLRTSALHLVVALTVLERSRWAQVGKEGQLGFERMKGGFEPGYRMLVFRGKTSDPTRAGFLPVPPRRRHAG
jgi:predicted component of type VI protein secretion system